MNPLRLRQDEGGSLSFLWRRRVRQLDVAVALHAIMARTALVLGRSLTLRGLVGCVTVRHGMSDSGIVAPTSSASHVFIAACARRPVWVAESRGANRVRRSPAAAAAGERRQKARQWCGGRRTMECREAMVRFGLTRSSSPESCQTVRRDRHRRPRFPYSGAPIRTSPALSVVTFRGPRILCQ